MRKIIVLPAIAAALMAGVTTAHAGDPKKGREIYVEKSCWSCHGYEGQGGVAGPRLSNTELPEEGFISFVHNSNGTMPPFSEKIIASQELADVHAFLLSLPKPPDAKTIPLLNQ
jgi:mono/diheme cytochrome c family protein